MVWSAGRFNRKSAAMAIRKSNLMIGTVTLAVIAVAFGGLLGVQKYRAIQSRSQLRVVFEGGSASGLRRGGPVNFDGVPAGQIISIKLDSPRKIVALVMLDNAAPIRQDTVAGIEFQGLTGVAAISLVGGAPSAPPVPLDEDGIPVLTADLSDAESIVETLHNVDRVIVGNEAAIKDGSRAFESYTADLKGKGAEIDAVMAKVDKAFAGFDSAVTKIEGVMPGFAEGKADELFEKVKGLRELAEGMKKKSAVFMEEGRKTLLDISEAANKMTGKFDPQGAPAPAPPPRPPRKPQQQR
jgi:phospholipid/cholesterol/gamma-HCH transport system substrate-binding protein